MQINRHKLSQHLARVMCNGQIEGAVFHDAFATTALSPDQLLLVEAPNLNDEDAEELEGQLGVPLLETWSAALSVLSPESPDIVSVEVRDHRLIISEGADRAIKLLTAAPETIGTFIKDKIRDAVLGKAPHDADKITITSTLLNDIRNTFSLLKANEVEFFVGKDGGKIRVGHENSNLAEFQAAELHTDDDPYQLLFGRHIIDVLQVVASGDEAPTLQLGGPQTPVLIKSGEYRYVLGPRNRGAGG